MVRELRGPSLGAARCGFACAIWEGTVRGSDLTAFRGLNPLVGYPRVPGP